jgi:lipopolysaccharide biosynthesis glycosyltransferase
VGPSVKSMGSRTNADERASREAAALPEPLVKIDVVTGYDSDFAQHLTVMLLLLADTNFGHSLSVFVLWSGTPTEQQKLQEVAALTPVRVHFIEIKRGTLADLVLRPIFSEMIYARLVMRDLLPRELDKILYLNSDFLVHGDIDELWAPHPSGAAVDLRQYRYNRELGLSDNALFSTRVRC